MEDFMSLSIPFSSNSEADMQVKKNEDGLKKQI